MVNLQMQALQDAYLDMNAAVRIEPLNPQYLNNRGVIEEVYNFFNFFLIISIYKLRLVCSNVVVPDQNLIFF